jgi:hypothetical protein
LDAATRWNVFRSGSFDRDDALFNVHCAYGIKDSAYGMNAGIADAMNLSWMMAGVIKGWADEALLVGPSDSSAEADVRPLRRCFFRPTLG